VLGSTNGPRYLRWASVDSAGKQAKLEAQKILKKRGESPASGARGARCVKS